VARPPKNKLQPVDLIFHYLLQFIKPKIYNTNITTSLSASVIQSVISESVGSVIASKVTSYATNPNTMDDIFVININAEFENETNIEIKLKLRVWKCEDGKFGMRMAWSRYVIETKYTCEYGNSTNAQDDEALDGGLHILKFCGNGLGNDGDEKGSDFEFSIAIETHCFNGTPFGWSLLRERCHLNYRSMSTKKGPTMRVRAREPDATTPVPLPGQL
jgi:hypothetical protein